MPIKARLTDKDPIVRAKAAGDLAAAAHALALSARRVRDRDANELLRRGERPAEVGRTIGVTRAQMVRFGPGDAEPSKTEVKVAAEDVDAHVRALLGVLDADDESAAASA